MKGYIYLLKETGHKTTYKVGRTNDLKRRLEQYNSGKTKIPTELLEAEGDILPIKRFSELDIEYKELILKNNDPSKIQKILKDEVHVQLCKRHKTEYKFEYIHTVKVKDCIEAEGLLLEDVFSGDDTYGRMGGQFESEWFSSWDIQLVKDTMDEIGEQINKRKYKLVKVPY
jgi:hypothetical protein